MGLEGDLASLGAGEVLQTLQLGSKSGVLLLSRVREQVLLCLRQGSLEAILAPMGERLSVAWTLYIEGLIDRQGREEWLDAFAEEEERLAQAIESMGRTRGRPFLAKHMMRLLVEIESWSSGAFAFSDKGPIPTQSIFLEPPLGMQGQWLEAVRRRDEIDSVAQECEQKSIVFRKKRQDSEELSPKALRMLEDLPAEAKLETAFDAFGASRYEALEALRELIKAALLVPISKGRPATLERAFWKGEQEEETAEVDFDWGEELDADGTEPEIEFATSEEEPPPPPPPPPPKSQPQQARQPARATPKKSGVDDAALRRKVRMLTEGLEEIVPPMPTGERWKRRLIFAGFVVTLCLIGLVILALNLPQGQEFLETVERWWSGR